MVCWVSVQTLTLFVHKTSLGMQRHRKQKWIFREMDRSAKPPSWDLQWASFSFVRTVTFFITLTHKWSIMAKSRRVLWRVKGDISSLFILRYVLTWAFPIFVDLKKPRHSLAEIQRGFLITESGFCSLQKKSDLHLLFTFQKREGLKQYPLLHLTLQAAVCSWCWFHTVTMRKLLVLLRKMSEGECGWDEVQW